MQKVSLFTIALGCFCIGAAQAASPLNFTPVSNRSNAPQTATTAVKPAVERKPAKNLFNFRSDRGTTETVVVADESSRRKLIVPAAKVDPKLCPTLPKAATIAQERANARSKSRCWRYVKQALLAAGAIDSYPKTALAKQAGDELVRSYGFKKLAIHDPYKAPVGAVLVYTARGAGHVEIRTRTGFVSDFRQTKPSKRKLIGIFAKA